MHVIALMAVLGLFAQDRGRGGRGGRLSQGPGAAEGKTAPNFKLKSQDGKKDVDLSKLKGKPTLLIFGSYT